MKKTIVIVSERAKHFFCFAVTSSLADYMLTVVIAVTLGVGGTGYSLTIITYKLFDFN